MLYRLTIGMCYSVYRGYALLSYLEYPCLVVQDIILLALFLHYNKQLLGPFWFGAFCAYLVVGYTLTTDLFPSTLIITLMVTSTIGIFYFKLRDKI